MCTIPQLDCVQNIRLKDLEAQCLAPCSGLILTSFSKSEPKQDLEKFIPSQVAAYKNYTAWAKFPSEMKGFLKQFIFI